MKPEYHEGPKAKEEFERTMVALFCASGAKPHENFAKAARNHFGSQKY
jgi:hypothetical protein